MLYQLTLRRPFFLARRCVSVAEHNILTRRFQFASSVRTTVLLLAILAAFLSGCSTVKEGHEPWVVQSERALTIAKETIRAFVTIEHDNRAWCRENLPMVHDSAEFMRKHAPSALAASGKALIRYKANRTPELKTAAREALQSVQSLSDEANENLSAINAKKP